MTRFEGSTEKANAGRRDHVGARADLHSVTTDLMDLVGLLEVLNHARFHDDAALQASWKVPATSRRHRGSRRRRLTAPSGKPHDTAA